MRPVQIMLPVDVGNYLLHKRNFCSKLEISSLFQLGKFAICATNSEIFFFEQ